MSVYLVPCVITIPKLKLKESLADVLIVNTRDRKNNHNHKSFQWPLCYFSFRVLFKKLSITNVMLCITVQHIQNTVCNLLFQLHLLF